MVAEPPTPTMIRRAPASRAAAISSPVPWVAAAIGSLPVGAADQRRGPRPGPSRSRPSACDSRHAASTGSPSGPVTVVRAVGAAERLERALAAVGHRQLDAASAGRPNGPRTAPATSAAVAVPRNLSGAATMRTRSSCLMRAAGASLRPAGAVRTAAARFGAHGGARMPAGRTDMGGSRAREPRVAGLVAGRRGRAGSHREPACRCSVSPPSLPLGVGLLPVTVGVIGQRTYSCGVPLARLRETAIGSDGESTPS